MNSLNDYTKRMTVRLGANSYDIVVKRGLLDEAGALACSRGGRVAIVTDDNVAPLYADRVKASFEKAGCRVDTVVLPAGEQTKRFETLPTIYARLLDFGMTRADLLVTLGGGVIGDLGGFAAATYLRGIDYVQIPTTLLAQVDSSVGGKVAVDLPQGKNLVGNFYQPKAVLIDPQALDTLSDRYFKDGMAEVIKYGCIADAELFGKLEQRASRAQVAEIVDDVVYACCDIKRKIVERDERDNGERMLLNYGHTYGHALEKYYRYIGLSHGEAIAVGMCEINRIAASRALTDADTARRVAALLEKFGLPTGDPAPADRVIGAIVNDKKNIGDTLNVVLLRAIGEGYLYPTTGGFFKR